MRTSQNYGVVGSFPHRFIEMHELMKSLYRITSLILCLAGVCSAQPATVDTFVVTIANKTPAHPYYHRGDPMGFSINGVEGADLTLVRGRTYKFQMVDIPVDRRFYFATRVISQGDHVWSKGVNPVAGRENRVVTFVPPKETPDTLYYQGGLEDYTGGRVFIVDSLVASIGERDIAARGQTFEHALVLPHPIRTEASISFNLDGAHEVRLEIVDMLGAKRVDRLQYFEDQAPKAFAIRADELGTGVFLYRLSTPAGASVTGSLHVSP